MSAILGLYGIQDRGRFPTARWTHDHNLALVEGGRVQWALELERFTRRKRDNRLPELLEELVERGVVELPAGAEIVSADSLVGRTFLSRSGRWRVEADRASLDTSQPLQRAHAFIGLDEIKARVCFHELAHVGANLPFCRGFEDGSLLVHIDGGASQCNASAFVYRHGVFEHVYHGWDTLWPILNFGYNDLVQELVGLDEDTRLAAAGRVMGLASHARPDDELSDWLEGNDWFRDHWQRPEAFFQAARARFGWSPEAEGRLDTRDPFLQRIAASVQLKFERTVLGLLTRLRRETCCRRLYYSGGAALNIEVNRQLTASGMFDEVHIPPCCSDTGLALGAAALAWFVDHGPLEAHSPFLQSRGLGPSPAGGVDLDLQEVARRLSAGQVVATCIGAAEVGPRALGHRSLLAAPGSIELRDHVSQTMKRRAWYRPVAPIVHASVVDRYFPGAGADRLTRYMLTSYHVASGMERDLCGALHVDGTARVQVVDDTPGDAVIPSLLLRCLHEHGLPGLINTSFNGPGEPLVHGPEGALEAAGRLGVDVLITETRMWPLSPASLRRLP